MQLSLAVESRALALDIHSLLAELDPARWRAELEAAARSHVARIDARLAGLRAMPTIQETALASSVAELSGVLEAHVPAADLPIDRVESEWADFRTRLQPVYEALANALRSEAIHVPTRRPTNYARNALHLTGATVALALVHLLLDARSMLIVALGLTLWAWSMELGRRAFPAVNRVLMALLGPFAHPHESYRVNSSTWYCTALLLLSLTGSKLLILTGLAVLGFADPLAAIVGRRWGSIKLVHGRSLQGSLAFGVTGTLAAGVVTLLARPELEPGTVLALAGSAALLGAIAELFSLRIDDNLSIPLAAAAGAGLVAAALGIAL